MSIQGSGGYASPWSSQSGLQELEGTMGELEPLNEMAEVGFEPQTRQRSNTWPLPRPDNYIDPADDGSCSKKNSNQNLSGAPPLPSVGAKKNSSRRNAWGNLSYADLITQAITSAQDNRLTLSQIYEWMVQNVPYFKDKGDSNSSAGWKVLCALNFLATGSYQRVVGVTQHLTQRTTSRCIRDVVDALNHNSIIKKWIVFPQTPQERSQNKEAFQSKHSLPGVIGCIDCTHIAIVKPVENEHLYFNRKGYHSLNVQMNSIRHNLSLHNRFMRVQNEGTGKSSWWMINPDAKPGKSVRRRAASMETSKFEKRRGRVKKKAEALRNGVTADATPSPSSSVSESVDMFPDSPMQSSSGFQLSPDFRQRASSNASSCGRLSPISSMIASETDWASDYTPASDYTANDYANSDFSQADYAQEEQLAGSLADSMKLQAADPFLNTQYVPTTSSSSSGGSYRYGSYGSCPRHPHGPCACAMYSHPAHPAHATHPHQHALDQFVRPPPPADQADIMHAENSQAQMVTTSDAALMNGGMMVQSGAMGPTTVMGQIMGALNTGLAEDLNLNIETLECSNGFDCNVDEVIKHELSMDGSLDFNFPQQHAADEADSHFAEPAPPIPTTLSGGGPRTPYSVTPSWVH